MAKYLVSINDLPPDGKSFNLTDQEIWLDPIREFKMDCRIEKPLEATISVQPAEDGCLVRGAIGGEVVTPCNRCAENARIGINAHFDEFEEIPLESALHKGHGEGESHVVYERHAPMLDLGGVAWEQFMLAMPVNPLCRPDCKGLCPICGANLNLEACDCHKEEEDPRMAPLRNLKVGKK